MVRGAHGRESDAWWSIPYLIVHCPGVVRRPTVEPLPDTGDVATPVSAEALRQRACLLLVPRSTHRIPQAERKREIWVGEGGGSDVRRAWYGLAELAPHAVSMATMQLRRSTPYATRHVVQDVVRDQLWPIEERNELNRWAALPRRVDADGSAAGSGKCVQSARRRAVTRYSAGDAALTKRLELRLEAVRIVSAFISASGGQWCDALPHQVGDQSSFSFLRDVSDRTAAGSE